MTLEQTLEQRITDVLLHTDPMVRADQIVMVCRRWIADEIVAYRDRKEKYGYVEGIPARNAMTHLADHIAQR
jgi:hypothetical protein